jgi:uncharacterized protein (TIGR03435 family)
LLVIDGTEKPTENEVSTSKARQIHNGIGKIMRQFILLSATAAIMAMVVPISAGRAAQLSFEAASVKLNREGGGRSMRVTPGRISYTRVTLIDCIAAAYGVQYFQITGPDWLQFERYDIAAKAEGDPGRVELMRMLQTLLSDRFKLTFHREKKELPIYALLVGKREPRLHRTNGEGASGILPAGPNLTFHNVSMSEFAGLLSGRLVGRPVLDKTGLEGNFDFALRLFDIQSEARTVDEGKRAIGALDPSAFVDAIEQLGLKLEAQKEVLDFLIIDAAERVPTEN